MNNTYVIRDRLHWADHLPWLERAQIYSEVYMLKGLERGIWYGGVTWNPKREPVTYFFPADDHGATKKQFDDILTAEYRPKGILEQIRQNGNYINWPPDPAQLLKEYSSSIRPTS